jgi:hypothetical protein
MAYVKNTKFNVPKAGRPMSKRPVIVDEISDMANQLGIDKSATMSLPFKLRAGQVFRYGRVWECVGGRWCPTPPIAPEEEWLDCVKVTVPDFMATWKRGFETSMQKAFIEQERQRIWVTGVWVRKLGGVVVWVSPWHYGVLNYWQMFLDTEDGLKEYRDKDRRRWLHFATGYRHPLCFGQDYLKRRRDGASIDGGFFLWWSAARKRVQFSGMMSYDDDHGSRAFEQMVRNPFYELPEWLMPIHSTSRASDHIAFNTPAERRTAKNPVIRKDESLKGWIRQIAPSEKGFDGNKMAALWFTEAGKLKKISVRKWLNVNKLTIKEGPRKVGFIFMETTCDELASGGQEFQKVFNSGEKVFPDGSTENGMWSLFIPAFDGYQGFVDEEGESIIDYPTDRQWAYMQSIGHKERIGAKEYQQRERDKLAGSPEDLIEYIRKEPWTKQEAFDSSNTECHFNLQNLSAMKSAIIEVGEETLWQRGNFRWMDRDKTVVGWEKDDNAGRFQVAWFPPDNSLSNAVKRGSGGWEPMNRKLGVIGLDPFNNAVIRDKRRGSMGGMTGYLYFDYKAENENRLFRERHHKDKEGYHPTPSVFLRYVARPASMNIFYEDVLMACWFYGMPLANERQINKIEMFMSNRECLKFMLSAAQMKGPDNSSNDDYMLYGLPMTDELSWSCIELLNGFLNGDSLYFRECQYKIYDDPRRLPFLDAIENLMAFRNDNRTVADWVMSFMQAVKAEEGVMDLSNPFLRVTRDLSSLFSSASVEREVEEWKNWQKIPSRRG